MIENEKSFLYAPPQIPPTRPLGMTLHFSLIKVDVLKIIRYPLSQKKWNEKLGYKFNQVLKWETHQKNFQWRDFCLVCEVAQLPLQKALKDFFNLDLQNHSGSNILHQILKYYYAHETLESVAEQMHMHVSCLRRWTKDIGEPDLEFIFKLLEFKNLQFISFLKELLKSQLNLISDIPPWLSHYHQEQSVLSQVQSFSPSLCALHACFYLESYKEVPPFLPEGDLPLYKFLSEKTGLPLSECISGVQYLLNSGILFLNPQTQKLETEEVFGRTDMTPKNLNSLQKLVSYWTQRAAVRFDNSTGEIINKKNTPNFVGYRIAPVSKTSQEKINELLIQTERQILEILEKDSDPMVDVRVVLLHHFSAEDIISPSK